MLKPTQEFLKILQLHHFNRNRSSAVIPFDSTGITNSLPLAIFKAPITFSAASVANFYVFVFFSSKGMHCSIPLNGTEEPTELTLPLEQPLSATILENDI